VEFVEALAAGPQPNQPEYRQMLNDMGLPWTETPLREEEDCVAFKGVIRDGQVEMVKFRV